MSERFNISREYQPETDFIKSQEKLQRISGTNVGIPLHTLFEGILDVLASRGGPWWKELAGISLATSAGLRLYVGYQDPGPEVPKRYAFISHGSLFHDDPDLCTQLTYKIVEVRGWYGLKEQIETEDGVLNEKRISIAGNLAPARLFGLLADAHVSTPFVERCSQEDDLKSNMLM